MGHLGEEIPEGEVVRISREARRGTTYRALDSHAIACRGNG